MGLIALPRGRGGFWPHTPRLNRDSPLASGLIFYAGMGENGELAAHDAFGQIHQASSIIHPGVSPAGYARYRTDNTTPLPFPFFSRQAIGTGPFTVAIYGMIDSEATARTIFGNNTATGRANQLRMLTNFDGSGNNAGYLNIFTFSSSASSQLSVASGLEPTSPHWYVAVRRTDGVLQLYRDSILLAESSALTLRDVSGSVVDGWNIGTGTTSVNSTGRAISKATAWSRALLPVEIQLLAEAPDALIERKQSIYLSVTAAASLTGTGALSSDASIIAGTGAVNTTGTGALASGVSSIAGTGERSVVGTGALASGASQISGRDVVGFPTGWVRKAKLTIQQVSAALTNFPILLSEANLPEEPLHSDGPWPAIDGGGDIRFSSDAVGATQLACEVITFSTNATPASAKAEVWVNVPNLSATGTTDIYIWWSKAGETQPAATDTYGRNNVWDTNYKGVWHLGQDPSGTAPQFTDSTSNGNNGTSNGSMTSGQSIAAQAGNGVDLDGTDDYLTFGTGSALAITSDITIEATLKPDATTDALVITRTKGTDFGYAVWVSSDKLTLFLDDDGSTPYAFSLADLTNVDTSARHHYAWTLNRSLNVSKALPGGTITHAGNTVYNSKLYVFGGHTGNPAFPVSTVRIYDQSVDSWSTGSSTGFTARWGCAAAEVSGVIYVFSGNTDGTTATAVTQAYNVSGDSWANKTNVPSGLEGQGLSAIALGGKIYLLKGQTFYEYDPVGDSYTAKTSRSVNAANTWSMLATDGTDIFAFGGFHSASIDKVGKWTASSNTWSDSYDTIPYTAWAGHPTYDATHSCFWYFGGRKATSGVEQERRMYKWNGISTWTQMPSDTAPANALAYGLIAGKIYYFGMRFYGTAELQSGNLYGAEFDTSNEVWNTYASSVKYYKDGALVIWTGRTNATKASAAGFEIGNQDSFHSSLFYNGVIDEVRVSNTYKSDSAVEASYDTLFAPATFVADGAAGGAVERTGAGALSSDASIIAGTGVRTVVGTGALNSDDSIISQKQPILGTGALNSADASISGFDQQQTLQQGAGKSKAKRARTRILRDEQLTAEDRRRLGVPEPQEVAPEAEQATPGPKRAKRTGKASRGIQLAPEADLEAQRAAEILEARTAELMAQQQAATDAMRAEGMAMLEAAAAIEADNELMMLLLMAA